MASDSEDDAPLAARLGDSAPAPIPHTNPAGADKGGPRQPAAVAQGPTQASNIVAKPAGLAKAPAGVVKGNFSKFQPGPKKPAAAAVPAPAAAPGPANAASKPPAAPASTQAAQSSPAAASRPADASKPTSKQPNAPAASKPAAPSIAFEGAHPAKQATSESQGGGSAGSPIKAVHKAGVVPIGGSKFKPPSGKPALGSAPAQLAVSKDAQAGSKAPAPVPGTVSTAPKAAAPLANGHAAGTKPAATSSGMQPKPPAAPAVPAGQQSKPQQAATSNSTQTKAPTAAATAPQATPPASGAAASQPKPASAAAPAQPKAAAKRLLDESDSDDSEGDTPLAKRMAASKPPPKPAAKLAAQGPVTKAAAKPASKPASKPVANGNAGIDDDFSEEDQTPLAKRKPPVTTKRGREIGALAMSSSEDESSADESSSDDDKPLALRQKDSSAKKAPAPAKRRSSAPASTTAKRKRATTDQPPKKKKAKEDASVKWTSLQHSGVLFPPGYEPHGVKMLYDKEPVDLTSEQEEVATGFAIMKETDYMNKPKFLSNFWAGFSKVLGPGHVIKDLGKCDFTPIYDHLMAEREAKKGLAKEEKARIKAERDAAEAKYKTALVDGRQEQVGNFRVEPPGLFRGRGEHPRMGMLKKRIYPKDITINIGKGEPIPEHPYPGQQWKEIRHDNTVTWLAFWKDTISEKDYKYVWLAANSTFKADSDLAKYEKARKLKAGVQYHVASIRAQYEGDWRAKSQQTQQMGVALYFIDKLALRAGHEKDEDEADTVGCCTLKVGNVECVGEDHIRFDFLGKDSMRYENEVAVHPTVFTLMQAFCKGKKPDEDVFDLMNATDLNNKLRDLMDGLTVKVFRTYNASIVLDELLWKAADESETPDEKKADYDRANKEVAILCNHQRSVPKGHVGQMEKMETRLLSVNAELESLTQELNAAKRGKPLSPGGKVASVDVVAGKISRKKEQLAKLELSQKVKEDLKTVALGTSKINYLDPRITVAWCKRLEVPMEKIFNKSLLSKFHWAMEVEPDFRF